MVDPGHSSAHDGHPRRQGGVTRGFLFSDLRGYTAFVDRRGAGAAAKLLERYRVLVRAAVREHDGAEIKTEGDSFYVVFEAASDAVQCALAIVGAARAEDDGGRDAIQVGVGVHAGEALETAEGYVGQPVNIAARLCALAAPGEVLVSETVRSLTHSVVDVTWVSRGRRRLKGIADPVHVFVVRAGAQALGRRARLPRGSSAVAVVAIAAAAVIALAGVVWVASRPAAVPVGEWKIGVSLPLGGEIADRARPLLQAVELAVADAKADGLFGDAQVTVVARDDVDGRIEEPRRAADNAAAFVADPAVIAMIGPLSSLTAEAQIPITNEAGLLQCNASGTDPALTKPRAGALDLRAAYPTRINFVRLPAAADIEATAAASFVFHDLGYQRVLLIDDTLPVGGRVADNFQRAFELLGGTIVRRALNPGAPSAPLLLELDSAFDGPALVYFAGFTNTGGADVRLAMVEDGRGDVPFMSWDGLWDGSGAVPESFIGLSGAAAAGSYVSRPAVGTVSAEFERGFRAAYGSPPVEWYEYTAAAYACVEIVVSAFRQAFAGGAAPAAIREAIRAHVADPGSRFDTVVGSVAFDQNGDSVHQVVTFYRADPTAGGVGNWVVVKQQDFGPAP
jgi:branched-chain amino acid transport system substrate-binding protein